MLLTQVPFSPRNNTDNSDAFRSLVLARMVEAAPLLNYAEFYTMQGTADMVLRESAIGQTVATRALNSNYTPQTNSLTPQTVTLTRLGGQVQTDIAIERMGEAELATRRVQQMEEFARSLGRQLQAEIIGAPSVAVAFQTAGGHSISNAATSVFNSTQLINFNGANGGQVLLGNSDASKQQQQQFLEALDNLCLSVQGGAQVLIMNAQVLARLKAIAREYVVSTSNQDVFGQPIMIETYNNIPIINAGFLANGTAQVISNTETLGTSTNCTSIYAARFGERSMFTLPTNVGVSVTDNGAVGQQLTATIEIDCGGLCAHSRAVARLQGVRLS
jgi:hypothetical protein